ncbi:Mariner Mos1 transposase [Eumeta japonica]|uniref:Mariner Mos1 transposase n=1 Tax=Eumeta variegata TaxID=151549 RepID=A0A4C1XW25_EUMVA|nr:Mariner Mos1 transposase [Eumeta japonica]
MDELSVKCLLYAYDQVIHEPSAFGLQEMVNKMNDSVKKRGMKVNVGKTKVMMFERGERMTECDILIEDIAPSDYHLFRSMAHALSKQRFTSYEDTKSWVDSWIASKDKEFFRLGIRMLTERWKKVVGSDEQYFD